MNIKEINKLIDLLETDAEVRSHFNMVHYFAVRDCGTVACIAGHVLLSNGYKPAKNSSCAMHSPNTDTFVITASEAAKILGISNSDAKRLFTPRCETPWNNITPDIAAQVLKTFRDTGVIDFDKAAEELADAA